jgi:predicted MFS family arabinose efflux permease
MIGIAIGLLCSRLVIPRIGVAMLTAAAAILAVLMLVAALLATRLLADRKE